MKKTSQDGFYQHLKSAAKKKPPTVQDTLKVQGELDKRAALPKWRNKWWAKNGMPTTDSECEAAEADGFYEGDGMGDDLDGDEGMPKSKNMGTKRKPQSDY